jgi:hypothetical protein
MPKIEIEMNAETGEMETEIKRKAGTFFEKIVEVIKQVCGKPTRNGKTREYNIQPQPRGQIKRKHFGN